MAKKSDNAERVGVNAVEAIVLKGLGWIFREQPISEYAIDAHIEVTDGEPVLRKLGIPANNTGFMLFDTDYFAQSCPAAVSAPRSAIAR